MKEFQNNLINPIVEDGGYDILSYIQDYIIDHHIDKQIVNKYPYDVISYLIELGIPSKLHYLIFSINKIDPNTDLSKFDTIKIISNDAINMLMSV